MSLNIAVSTNILSGSPQLTTDGIFISSAAIIPFLPKKSLIIKSGFASLQALTQCGYHIVTYNSFESFGGVNI